ncbi:hypothetical protein CDIMF43_270021 [Carnobacterium divergens]|nr:hypothetical protein CDIMF43_270021 [Carnobacterium divergens]
MYYRFLVVEPMSQTQSLGSTLQKQSSQVYSFLGVNLIKYIGITPFSRDLATIFRTFYMCYYTTPNKNIG